MGFLRKNNGGADTERGGGGVFEEFGQDTYQKHCISPNSPKKAKTNIK